MPRAQQRLKTPLPLNLCSIVTYQEPETRICDTESGSHRGCDDHWETGSMGDLLGLMETLVHLPNPKWEEHLTPLPMSPSQKPLSVSSSEKRAGPLRAHQGRREVLPTSCTTHDRHCFFSPSHLLCIFRLGPDLPVTGPSSSFCVLLKVVVFLSLNA